MPASGDSVIRTIDLRVDYGDVVAVRDMNLDIGPGEVFGLIGPNGAGKTSTIKVLATLLEPTYGEVYVGGCDALEHPEKVHRILGYMPDMPPVHGDLKCWEFLDLFAHAHGLPADRRKQRIEQCMEQVELESKRDALAGTLSLGMKQRLVLAKTLLHDPMVLLLDEPASGLDPMARIQLRNTLKALAARGRTILVSSHILTELSDLCTSIGIMQKGLIVKAGRVGEIIASMKSHRELHIRVLDDGTEAARLLEGLDKVTEVLREDGKLRVHFTGGEEDVADLLAVLIGHGVRVVGFDEKHMNIEDIFIEIGAREVS